MQEEVEKAVGQLYMAFFRLRKNKMYKEEYDDMGTLMDMLMKDREHLRQNYKVG